MMNLRHCKLLKVCRNHKAPVFTVLFLFLLASISCKEQEQKHTATRSFYYWKTRLQFSDKEAQALRQLQITNLYIKFFDVGLNGSIKEAQPIGKIQMTPAAIQTLNQLSISVIPVIFITNETLLNLQPEQMEPLASRILQLLNEMQAKNRLPPFREFQIDCDWTQSTKEHYFALLQSIKKKMYAVDLLFRGNAYLSATIRLHQIKYRMKTGTPPADRGMLMCYNMGNLKRVATNNSILDLREFNSYLKSADRYPIPLDIALPLFDWTVAFRSNQYRGILYNINPHQLPASGKWISNRYFFSGDTTIEGIDFKQGDQIRIEKSEHKEILQAISLINKLRITKDSFTLSLFHLDESILNKHPLYELETYYRSLH